MSTETHLEALLEVLVLLEERGVVDNHLRIGNLQLHDLVVDRLCRLYCSDGLFEVAVERPDLE